MTVRISRVGAEAAPEVYDVVAAAFGARPALDPPADALEETVDSVARRLRAHGGLLVVRDGVPLATTILDVVDDVLYLRRVGVVPAAQHEGLAHRLVDAAVEVAVEVGVRGLGVLAREELPATIDFWRGCGFTETGREAPYLRLHRWLPRTYDVPDAEAMHELGRDLAAGLRAGDLVVLAGGLGAGKTTLTQGLGEGLGVRGGVTSPTFVIARVHPSECGGPALVHVDAYRLGGVAELDDLDLDTSLEDAVTVVEWGEGLAEVLADSRLEVHIRRATGDQLAAAAPGGEADPEAEADPEDPRRVSVLPVGPRWC